MSGARNLISTIELRRLLIDLKDKRQDICIRMRVLGEMWMKNFARIVTVTEKGIVLNDETAGKLINITNMDNVVQFELDGRFQNFQPHHHYDVKPS